MNNLNPASYVFAFILSFLLLSGCKTTNSAIKNQPDDAIAQFDKDRFFFGIATAPAHVEDSLDDMWLDFALIL